MKIIKKLFIFMVVLFSFSMIVNASCKDEDLNEWATSVEAKFIEITDLGLDSSEYAYLLTITNLRDDIKLVAYDGKNNKAVGRLLTPGFKETVNEETKEVEKTPEDKIQAIGCYTNAEEETYTIEVYGGSDSKCPNELLKTLKYTVPRFNRFIKDRRCQNNDSELCKTFTNSTKDMTSVDFDKAMKKETDHGGDSSKSGIFNKILEYGLYIIIPLVIVSVIYAIRINKFKKEERDR